MPILHRLAYARTWLYSPKQGLLAVPAEVLGKPFPWSGVQGRRRRIRRRRCRRGGQKTKNSNRICRANEHFTVADCWCDKLVSFAKLIALRDLVAVVEFG